ncbi:MAG: hypothetical protein J0M18_03770 [Ignavibacteria bacterium]|nr:hypothetical protein [Ignavibacteria bacterium]
MSYKKLNFSSEELKDKFKENLEQRYSYEIESTTPGLSYFNIKDRYSGKAFYYEEYSNTTLPNYDKILKELPQSPAYHYQFPVFSFDECIKRASEISTELNAETIAKFKSAFFHADENYMPDLLRYSFEETFLRKYPEGKIFYIRMDSTFYNKSGLMRAIYALANYPDIPMNNPSDFSGFNILNKWISVENHDYFNTLINIAEYIFFPYIMSFHTSWKLGIHFLFVPNEPIEFKLGKFPRDILDFARGNAEFAKNSFLISTEKSDIYSKYCFETPPTIDDYSNFVNWFLDKTQNFINFNFNVCNFPDETDPTKIDPIYPLEYNISLMHILKISLSIMASNSSSNNKSTLFQVADMLDGLSNKLQLGIPNSDTELFTRLFNKNYSVPLMSDILNRSSLNIKGQLINVLEKIYDDLEKNIKDSIWVRTKVNGNDVNVKNKALATENIENISDFTTHVIRALRNTHHGYLTRKDPRGNRPSRYLSLITGELPSTLPSLAFIWIICLLEDREKFLGIP